MVALAADRIRGDFWRPRMSTSANADVLCVMRGQAADESSCLIGHVQVDSDGGQAHSDKSPSSEHRPGIAQLELYDGFPLRPLHAAAD